MTENRFDELWQQMEARKYGRKLADEYPTWRKNRQRAARIVTMIILVVLVTVVSITSLHRPAQNFEKVYCNRVGTSDTQWVTLAAEMLLE